MFEDVSVAGRLATVGLVVLAFAMLEIWFSTGGMINSVSLFSDGAHNLADAGAFAIALAANHYAQHHTDLEESRRMQIMGGLLNVSICLILTLFAGVEAWKRLFDAGHMEEKAKIDGAYLAIAVCGILINGFGAMFLGGHGHSHGGLPVEAGGGCSHSGHGGHLHGKTSPPSSKVDEEVCQGGHSHGGGHSHAAHSHGHSHSHGHAQGAGEDGYQMGDQPHGRADGSEEEDMNLKAMWLHTLQDALGSAVLFVAGLIAMFSGWTRADRADAVAGLLISLMVWVTSVPVFIQCVRQLQRPQYGLINH